MGLALGTAVDAGSAEVAAVAHTHGGKTVGRRRLVRCRWGEEGVPRSSLVRNAGRIVVVVDERRGEGRCKQVVRCEGDYIFVRWRREKGN